MSNTILICTNDFSDNPSMYLPGISIDISNIEYLCLKFKIKCVHLKNKHFTAENLNNNLLLYQPTILWICSHGLIHNDRPTILLHDENFLSSNFVTNMLSKYLKKTKKSIIVIVDACHSGTLLNLEYYYKFGIFYRKIDDKLVSRFDFLNEYDSYIVYISGSTDFTKAEESANNGGALTNLLLNFFKKKRLLSLADLDYILKMNKDVVISTSKIFEDYNDKFIEFNFY